jgi:deoxyribodipyrimidine photolyase-related protein
MCPRAAKPDGCDTSVWILPTQLNPDISSLEGVEKDCPIVLIESGKDFADEPQHKRKLTLVFSAMRHFREEIEKSGRRVDYYALDDPCQAKGKAARGCYTDCLSLHIKKNGPKKIRVAAPPEYDLQQLVKQIAKTLPVPVEITKNNLFLTTPEEFQSWESKQSELVMENFYREMRHKLGVLMEGDYPIGGRWNFDTENRVPPMENMEFSTPQGFVPDEITTAAAAMVEKRFPRHPGTTEGFDLPVTRQDCRKWFDDFVMNRLKLFGMYQDAMVRENPVMYHSLLSPVMNIGLIHPLEAVRKVEEAYHNGVAPINSAEGFVRQVIGWREYIHGIYQSRMPEYRDENFFGHSADVPKMYYDGKTRMACVREAIDQCHRLGYTHHIQRLMVLGNFALLTGMAPKKVVKWFLSMYVDAYEWATLPNVIGMILFADGGYLGTKPYAASANYIGKMGNYCKDCYYKSRKRVGERACPFNFLYWYFLKKNEDLLRRNKRMSMVYNLLRRKSDGETGMLVRCSEEFLKRVHETGTDRRIRR